MIIEKSTITQNIIEKLSSGSSKVPFLSNETLVQALQYLEEFGIPNAKHEDYKYCNLEAVLKKEFQLLGQQFMDVAANSFQKSEKEISLVLINGNYSSDLSDQLDAEFIQVSAFNQVISKQAQQISSLANVKSDAFIALNTAFAKNGLFITICKNKFIEKPIRILNLVNTSTEAFLNTRNFIHLEEGAKAKFITETKVLNSQKVFINSVSERLLENNSQFLSTELQTNEASSYNINTICASLGKESIYESNTISTGGRLIRNNHNVFLNGEYSSAHLFGLFATTNNQLVDNHTLMDHRVPNCESNELYKGIANDKSIGVFNGKIFVQAHAQKTNAYQSSKNILLSDDASIYTKPQLEIYANDVKCSHGTSTGKIDEEALFYLKARGIGETAARKILLQAFAGDVIQHLPSEDLKEQVSALFETIL